LRSVFNITFAANWTWKKDVARFYTCKISGLFICIHSTELGVFRRNIHTSILTQWTLGRKCRKMEGITCYFIVIVGNEDLYEERSMVAISNNYCKITYPQQCIFDPSVSKSAYTVASISNSSLLESSLHPRPQHQFINNFLSNNNNNSTSVRKNRLLVRCTFVCL
ncbi:hypothetical protein L9F63_004454, partial [Diploptera punctata]